jgi:tRNA(fMet)-specific endonuclease VapC
LIRTSADTFSRHRPAKVRARFEEAGNDGLALSTVVLAELYYGAARHPKGTVIREEINGFAVRLAIMPWDESAADHYGSIRTPRTLQKQST